MDYIPIPMDRRSLDTSGTPAEPTVRPSEQHAELALREAAALMAPIARWLMRNGVPYPAFAAMLKSVFVDVARDELERAGARPTHSALSVLSGVHRKDVRSLETDAQEPRPAHSIPLASRVFTRWLTDTRYHGPDGKPRPLARSGPGPHSFETLVRERSADVHPRTVLDELLRSGLVRVDGDEVAVAETSFVPSRKIDELTALFSANASDHLAAAVHNLTVKAPKFLEQSIFADGMTQESVDHLHQCARQAWGTAFTAMVNEARQRVELDADAEADHRMRFGVYFYAEPVTAPQPQAARDEAPPAKRSRSRK
jgi:hypothetical protein